MTTLFARYHSGAGRNPQPFENRGPGSVMPDPFEQQLTHSIVEAANRFAAGFRKFKSIALSH